MCITVYTHNQCPLIIPQLYFHSYFEAQKKAPQHAAEPFSYIYYILNYNSGICLSHLTSYFFLTGSKCYQLHLYLSGHLRNGIVLSVTV